MHNRLEMAALSPATLAAYEKIFAVRNLLMKNLGSKATRIETHIDHLTNENYQVQAFAYDRKVNDFQNSWERIEMIVGGYEAATHNDIQDTLFDLCSNPKKITSERIIHIIDLLNKSIAPTNTLNSEVPSKNSKAFRRLIANCVTELEVAVGFSDLKLENIAETIELLAGIYPSKEEIRLEKNNFTNTLRKLTFDFNFILSNVNEITSKRDRKERLSRWRHCETGLTNALTILQDSMHSVPQQKQPGLILKAEPIKSKSQMAVEYLMDILPVITAIIKKEIDRLTLASQEEQSVKTLVTNCGTFAAARTPSPLPDPSTENKENAGMIVVKSP